MTTGRQVVDAAQRYSGTPYALGAEHDVVPGFEPAAALDCSELVQTALGDLGVAAPDGHWVQWEWCRDRGAIIPITQAIDTPGALLFVYDGTTEGHVAISRGDGSTIEARGRAWGTGNWPAQGRTWTHGALIPGIDYTEDPLMALTADDIKALVKEALVEAIGPGFDGSPSIIDGGVVKVRLDDGNYWPLASVFEFTHRHAKSIDAR